MKITVVKYGRTIEVGKFGRNTRTGKVWFGWEAELEEGETELAALEGLKRMADDQEDCERMEFDDREARRGREGDTRTNDYRPTRTLPRIGIGTTVVTAGEAATGPMPKDWEVK